jgi:aspartyl-tRNA(Asn)/glutamyl-tRNA(Gln) amidotransferase subunit B
MSPFAQYETVIGLECHVQLLTQSKLFSPAKNQYGDPPNANVDVVDLGLPGVLPVLNDKAVRFAVRLGLATGCTIRQHNVFARKHYFYPDLPKGYQISQMDLPICEKGELVVDGGAGEKPIRITRIHMEEDAGKNIHAEGRDVSHVDYNRAGTPLLEVVSEPDMSSAEEAVAYAQTLHAIAVAVGVCDGNMQEGSFRVDANVSVRKKGATALGQRTELKNLNSFRYLGHAIKSEARRQVLELEAGNAIVQETRLWDPDKKESRSMRGKEDAHDYRYFPDPDLLPVVITDDEIEAIRKEIPELPRAKATRFEKELGLSAEHAHQLTQDHRLGTLFESTLALQRNAKAVANWVINEAGATERDVTPKSLAALIALIEAGTITGKIAKEVFREMAEGRGQDPEAIVEEKGWRVERDEGALKATIQKILDDNPKQVAQFKAGKEKLLGFFVGQVMKATRGKSDPSEATRLIQEALKAEEPG